ncbi:hypothetical protein HBH64_046330 [Parastagonospora nodorum]|nr:hypothetical protein HBI02_154200 [Parastagonospora nodorum]KAH4301192.1 hypothetical protein HBI01_102730 [Parastagonospora nodorum]KAH4325822.1 hypothetical protein HBI00_146410 [Parastagonospora nodorum]KAH4365801.1 hypothetical protein HBH94_155560 [Parastagonospora nodorum]KAH4464835.1 hypothetical protein HBH90_103690 [Parastagonospora nodorum]
MSSTFADAKATRRYIQDDLTDKVLHVHSPTDAYIRYEDILHAWSGRTTIQKVLFRVELSQADIDTIHRRLLRFLSILVYVGANDFLSGPRSNFFHPNGEPVYEDKRFPVHNNDRDVLPIESLTIRTRFLNDQYIFFPEYVHESSQIRMIDVRLRLPFQEIVRNTASGAYGTVDKVGISPNYFITVERNRNHKVKLVACKRFHVSNPRRDSMRELKNLEILKESITSHANIRIHLAVLLYKGEHLILLPWADHHDLDHFLAEGFDFGGKPVYDFAEVFPLANNGALIKDVCVQMYRIADALAWLHEGIVAPVKEGRLYFAHMDLKPNNILIDKSNSSVVSVVGKWVLTDFGISAFREDDGSSTSDLPTIRDVYERLTIQTTPRREAGAYQPPEAQGVRGRDSGNKVGFNTGSVRRQGDIWAFACIFSEVLTFALGQASAVSTFRSQRTGRHKDDYFYESVTSQHLRPNDDHHMYEVRAEVLEWLRKLVSDDQSPNRGIECCVSTILKMLVTDASQRPKAKQLAFMMNHVKTHISSDEMPVNSRNCPLNNHIVPPNIPTSPETPVESSASDTLFEAAQVTGTEYNGNIETPVVSGKPPLEKPPGDLERSISRMDLLSQEEEISEPRHSLDGGTLAGSEQNQSLSGTTLEGSDIVESSVKGREWFMIDSVLDDTREDYASIFSNDEDIGSTSGSRGRGRSELYAVKAFGSIFAKWSELRPQHEAVILGLGPNRFVRNYRRILKLHLLKLRRFPETRTYIELIAIRILQSRRNREDIARNVLEALYPKKEEATPFNPLSLDRVEKEGISQWLRPFEPPRTQDNDGNERDDPEDPGEEESEEESEEGNEEGNEEESEDKSPLFALGTDSPPSGATLTDPPIVNEGYTGIFRNPPIKKNEFRTYLHACESFCLLSYLPLLKHRCATPHRDSHKWKRIPRKKAEYDTKTGTPGDYASYYVACNCMSLRTVKIQPLHCCVSKTVKDIKAAKNTSYYRKGFSSSPTQIVTILSHWSLPKHLHPENVHYMDLSTPLFLSKPQLLYFGRKTL